MEASALIVLILGWVIGLAILYVVVRAAVRGALSDHYKTVRLFEATGQWVAGNHGSGAPRDLAGNRK